MSKKLRSMANELDSFRFTVGDVIIIPELGNKRALITDIHVDIDDSWNNYCCLFLIDKPGTTITLSHEDMVHNVIHFCSAHDTYELSCDAKFRYDTKCRYTPTYSFIPE